MRNGCVWVFTSQNGGAKGIRTPDLLIANETRYQLRHSPKDLISLAPERPGMKFRGVVPITPLPDLPVFS